MLQVEIRSVRDFAPDLMGEEVEDWQLIVGLFQRGAEGLLTCDERMLSLADVVAVIEQTHFSVVVCQEAGHDPVRATGLLLTHLPAIGRQHVRSRPQVWKLRARQVDPMKISDLKRELQRRNPGLVVDDYRVSREMLGGPINGT